MKKIIFVVVCLCSVKVVNAEGLILTYLCCFSLMGISFKKIKE